MLYVPLKSSFVSTQVFVLISGDIYLFVGISVSVSVVPKLFYGKFFDTVILLAILLPIK